MIGRLVWKETREHLWKSVILLLTALACFTAGYLMDLRSQIGLMHYATPTDWAPACLFVIGVIAPVWIASGFTAAERHAGSFDVLLALPLRPSVLFAIKALMGLFAYLLPLALAWCLQWLAHPRVLDNPFFFTQALLISVSIYFLMLTVTASTRSESRAAMIGVLALLTCVIWAFLAVLLMPRFEAPPSFWLFPNPFMLSVVNDSRGAHPGVFNFQVAILLFWAAAALWRFLRTASNTGTGSQEQTLPVTRTLLRPLPQPPLIWKEVREQFSVFAIAFWTAVGVAFMTIVVEIFDSMHAGNGPVEPLLDVFGIMLQVMLIGGLVMPLLISVVLGVGAFAGDLDRRHLHFWRGQPIPIGRWFWTKYLVSATGILLLLIVPLSFAAGGSTIFDAGSDAGHMRESAWVEFLFVIVFVPFAHALSIFLASLIRRTMYATITTIALLIAVASIPFFGGSNFVQILTDPTLPSRDAIYLFGGSLLLSIGLLSAARYLLANDARLA